jgi:hypothetical protein
MKKDGTQMECNRVVTVIDQLRSNEHPDILFDEVVFLKNQGYLTKFESRESLVDYGNQLTQFHQQYSQALNELNILVADLMRTRLDFVRSNFLSKMFSKLRIGPGGSLYSKILMLNKTIKHKQEELGFIKSNLLRVTAQRDALDQSVALYGENILVTTTGDSIASQIRGRPRFGAREFTEFQSYLQKLDEEAGKVMGQIQRMIQGVEQTVLRSQSVQFMPELLEYGTMIMSNANFIMAANNVDASFFIKWQTLLLPCIMAVHVNSLENQIESYLKTRPLSYITNPRPYYYSHGFFIRTYRPHYGYYGGYPRGPRSPVSHNFSRGGRYSSLHHHTIG